MSDLIEQSRACADRVLRSKFPDYHAAKWLERQADEIERLTAEVKERRE